MTPTWFLACPTTVKHFTKYEQMRRKLHISLAGTSQFLGRSVRDWAIAFRFDKNLNGNGIRLVEFDNLYPMHLRDGSPRPAGYSLADNVCVYKHAITYQMIKAAPVPEDDPTLCYCLDGPVAIPIIQETTGFMSWLKSVQYDWRPTVIPVTEVASVKQKAMLIASGLLKSW